MQEGPSQRHHHHHLLLDPEQQPPPQQQRSQRYGGGGRGLRSTPGEIVEVQGGHIVRSTGRKDRHSKVCTAKGPRDRRVRLSAHTAIQFYDVQDRLGYDRPSKAVDWLINNAKAAIDELAELPAWHPTATPLATNSAPPPTDHEAAAAASASQMHVAAQGSSSHYEFTSGGGGGTRGGASSSFLPPSLDSDAIADTIKSFFPIAAAAPAPSSGASSSPIGFQSYPPDLLSRTSIHNQDLRLSLQSFQDQIFQQHHHQQETHSSSTAAAGHHSALFSGFDTATAIIPWNVTESNAAAGSGGGGGGGGFVFNVPFQQQQQQQQAAAAMAMHPALMQSQFFTQRGPLQSSNLPFVRAWADPVAAADHPMQQYHHQYSVIHPPAPSFGAGTGAAGFSGFRVPARIQGEEEHVDGISDKPSSASSGSHH